MIGHHVLRYEVVEGWGVLDSSKYPVADCHEMVIDRAGRIFLLTNETKNNILIYDTSGKLIGCWGHVFLGGHGLTIGEEDGVEFANYGYRSSSGY